MHRYIEKQISKIDFLISHTEYGLPKKRVIHRCSNIQIQINVYLNVTMKNVQICALTIAAISKFTENIRVVQCLCNPGRSFNRTKYTNQRRDLIWSIIFSHININDIRDLQGSSARLQLRKRIKFKPACVKKIL